MQFFTLLKKSVYAVLVCVVFCAWGSERTLLETSYPLPANIGNNHFIRVQVGEAGKSIGRFIKLIIMPTDFDVMNGIEIQILPLRTIMVD